MSAGIPSAVQASGNIKYFQIILSAISLVGLPIAYLFFKNNYPPQTLFIVYTFISISMLLAMQVILKKLISFNVKEFFLNAYLKMINVTFLISPLFLIKYFIDESTMRFFFSTIFSLVWLLITIYFVGINSIERDVVKNIIINKIKRK